MKVHYLAQNDATMNFQLERVGVLQKSAIFAKISQKSAKSCFFRSRVTILHKNVHIFYLNMVEIFFQNIFSSSLTFAKIYEFHTFSKPFLAQNRQWPTSFFFEPLSIPVGLPLPINRCSTTIWGCLKN